MLGQKTGGGGTGPPVAGKVEERVLPLRSAIAALPSMRERGYRKKAADPTGPGTWVRVLR